MLRIGGAAAEKWRVNVGVERKKERKRRERERERLKVIRDETRQGETHVFQRPIK